MTIAETSTRANTRWPELPSLAAPIAAMALAFLGAPPIAVRAGATTALAFMMLRDLNAARFSPIAIAALTILTFAQAGLFFCVSGNISPWPALAASTVASSASSFAARRNPRNVILLGGSLAVVQMLHAAGGVIAAIMLPVCAGLPRSIREAQRTAGLYALLVFIPAMMAVLLAYLHNTISFEPSTFLDASIAVPTASHSNSIFMITAFALCAPVIWLAISVKSLRRMPGFLVAATAGAMTIAAIAAASDIKSLLAAIAACSVTAIASWRRAAKHMHLALAASALAAIVSWLLIAALPLFGD
ncbi:MAG TPA: hypothetical protein VK779_04045 [Rhizomicrobium sp.]|jgi:hypothetical protein|nr:hypothetical protein [Rhizomicrobium sp.]